MDAITTALSGQTTSRLVVGGAIGLLLAKKLMGGGHAREPSTTALGARVVLITGCDSGFGRRLVEAALAEGFEVVAACYRTSTPKTAATPSNALAISVDDVAAELARAETAGLRTEPAALRSYPVLGEALVGACFVDDCRVEFVRFLDC